VGPEHHRVLTIGTLVAGGYSARQDVTVVSALPRGILGG
jgi:hypothetical protein